MSHILSDLRVGWRGRRSSRTATATVSRRGRLWQTIALPRFVITAFTRLLRSAERPNRWSRIRYALLGLLIRIRRFRSCDAPVERNVRNVRHQMATTLWPRRSGTLSETCGLGTSDAYIDAGYVFMRAHWEYPLSLEILVPAWRWWATRPGSWRRLSYRLFSNRSQNGRLGIYALLFQV